MQKSSWTREVPSSRGLHPVQFCVRDGRATAMPVGEAFRLLPRASNLWAGLHRSRRNVVSERLRCPPDDRQCLSACIQPARALCALYDDIAVSAR
jgi:hypothetical protein